MGLGENLVLFYLLVKFFKVYFESYNYIDAYNYIMIEYCVLFGEDEYENKGSLF